MSRLKVAGADVSQNGNPVHFHKPDLMAKLNSLGHPGAEVLTSTNLLSLGY